MIKKKFTTSTAYNLAVILLFAIIAVQLFSHQIINGSQYEEISRRNYVRIRRVTATRGMILDEKYRPIVINIPSINLYFRPAFIADRQEFIDFLTSNLEVTQEQLERLIYDYRFRPFEEVLISENLQEGTMARVAEGMNRFPELLFKAEVLRHYIIPNHFTGYVGRINEQEFRRYRGDDLTRNSLIGKTGIERYYEGLLAGKSGYEIVQVDALGKSLRLFRHDLNSPPVNGFNIVLTINLELQEHINQIFPKDRAGTVVVLNPKTGGILAYNSFPEFDQNWFASGISTAQWNYLRDHELRPLLDRVVMGTYPPGSTFKTVSAAYAIEKNLINENTRLAFCDGGMRIGDRVFRCWYRWGHGRRNIYEAMSVSCSVYFYDISSRFNLDEFQEFAQNSFLLDRTGIDLPSERAGFFPRTEWYRNRLGRYFSTLGIRANLSIGQGEVLVSPLALASYYGAIGNEGVWHTPHLFREAFNENTFISEGIVEKHTKILPYSENTLRVIQRTLHDSVYREGATGRNARVQGADIYAKTGTAENPQGDQPHAVIAGYAKWDGEAEIAFLVMIENGGWGGSTAGPIARQIIQFYQDRVR
ncbi:MAG: penicillin-binding protein 2 [Candidatus Cloacimonetes bacterium]|nr:penicillin-binding protein 2 [Candidatus Cloacimonadota bacterium]